VKATAFQKEMANEQNTDTTEMMRWYELGKDVVAALESRVAELQNENQRLHQEISRLREEQSKGTHREVAKSRGMRRTRRRTPEEDGSLFSGSGPASFPWRPLDSGLFGDSSRKGADVDLEEQSIVLQQRIMSGIGTRPPRV